IMGVTSCTLHAGARAGRGRLNVSSIASRRYGNRGLSDFAIVSVRARICCRAMTTLAFNHEEIAPRELKASLYELDGISRESVEAHYKLYQGYVAKRNEILTKLAEVDLDAANQVYSEIRALKVDLSFAIGGIKNHELYFDHLGGGGGDPDG